MKIRTFISVILILLGYSACSQIDSLQIPLSEPFKGEIDQEKRTEYFGPVKSVISKLELFQTDSSHIGFKYIQYSDNDYYNENGKHLKREHFELNGEITSYHFYNYNENDQLIEVVSYYESDSTKPESTIEYFYNDDGSIKYLKMIDDFNNDIEPYIYDETGRLIEYEYNSSIFHYEYKHITKLFYKDSLRLDSTVTYQTLKTGWIWKRYCKRNTTIDFIVYYQDNLSYEMVIYPNTEYEDRYISRYDAYGNEIYSLNIHHGEIDNITTYQYEYDEYNNWIRCSITEDGKLDAIVTREISYYKN